MTENNRRLILVVDDEPNMRMAVADLLIFEGHDAITAEDGLMAVELALQMMPDLIVMNWMMPRLDGIGAIKQLRNDPRTTHIPIIMFSRFHEEDRIQFALEQGADRYLVLPCDADELLGVVRELLRS